jgi:hypothetical protein
MLFAFEPDERAVLIVVGGVEALRSNNDAVSTAALVILLRLEKRQEHLMYFCPDQERVEEVISLFKSWMSEHAVRAIRSTAGGLVDLPESNATEGLIFLHGRAAQYMGSVMLHHAHKATDVPLN